MANVRILLIGRPSAGKTTMAKIMSEEEVPANYSATNVPKEYDAKDGNFFFNIGHTKIIDTGGNDQNKLNVWSRYSWNYIFYVFNGNEFLKELDAPWNGGPIGAELRHDLRPIFDVERIKKSKKQYLSPEDYEQWERDEFPRIESRINNHLVDGVHDKVMFIATYSDKCVGNMKDLILQKIERAKNEYIYGMRYFFYKQLTSKLYCINATNPKEVKDLFKVFNG